MTDRGRKLGDKSLGMDTSITRRDFLGATLLASGAQLLNPFSPAQLLAKQSHAALPGSMEDWNGYGGVGEYANSNGNTWEVLSAGHKLRDSNPSAFLKDAADIGELYDCVVVGGGISGLAAAALFLRQARPGSKCLVLENHPIFGGEAKQNEFDIDCHRVVAHQGTAIYFVPYPRSFLADFYDAIGLHEPRLSYQAWGGSGAAMTIGRTPYDSAGMSTGQYGFWFGPKFIANDSESSSGKWLIDPVGRKFAGAPVNNAARAELLHWYSGGAADHAKFAPPQYEGDEVSRSLDAVTLEDHYIQRFGLTREFIRKYLSPDLGGGSGLGADALSAFSEYAADLLHPYEKKGEAVQMFPGGNTTIARLIVKTLIPAAFAGDATPDGVTRSPINFAALDRAESKSRIRLGSTVLQVSHEGDPASADSPVVLTVKILFSYPGLSTETQGHRGRGELLATSFREYERRIRNQFSQMFSSVGFDAQRDIAGIVLNRWGHAYLSPQPGFFFGTGGRPAPREVLRAAPFGRIAFANTDLAGAMDHRFSILEARRAVSQLFEAVLD